MRICIQNLGVFRPSIFWSITKHMVIVGYMLRHPWMWADLLSQRVRDELSTHIAAEARYLYFGLFPCVWIIFYSTYNITLTCLEYSLLAIVQISVFRKTVGIRRKQIPMFQWKILKLNYSLACDLCTVYNITATCSEHPTLKINVWVVMLWNNVCRLHKNIESGSLWSTCTVYLIYWLKITIFFSQLARSTVWLKFCVYSHFQSISDNIFSCILVIRRAHRPSWISLILFHNKFFPDIFYSLYTTKLRFVPFRIWRCTLILSFTLT